MFEIIGFVGIFWKNSIWKVYLPKTSIVGQIVLQILVLFCSDDSIQILLNLTWFPMLWTESSEHNWANIWLKDNLPRNANFWQVGLLNVVLSYYPEKSHKIYTNSFFLWHHTSGLYKCRLSMWQFWTIA